MSSSQGLIAAGRGVRTSTPRQCFSGTRSHPKGRWFRRAPPHGGRGSGWTMRACPCGRRGTRRGQPCRRRRQLRRTRGGNVFGGCREAVQGLDRATGQRRRGAGATSLDGRRRRGRDRDRKRRAGERRELPERRTPARARLFQPDVASLPGDAMTGATGPAVRPPLRCAGASGSRGVRCPSRGRKALGPWS